jgi:hypothetical protein
MVFKPEPRLLPFTVNVAVAFDPEATSEAEPSVVGPIVKETLPVGAFAPDAGVIVTAICVMPLDAIVAGVAVAAILVVIAGGGFMVSTAAAEELPKEGVPP